jgi:hypothetical protein
MALFYEITADHEVRFETFAAPFRPRRDGSYRISILPKESRPDRAGVAIEITVSHPDEIASIRTSGEVPQSHELTPTVGLLERDGSYYLRWG